MKIKEVKEPKNKEELKGKIKNKKFDLKLGRLIVCLGAPSMLAILGMAIKNSNNNFSFIYSIFALGALIEIHYLNQDNSSKLARLEDQLSKMEEDLPSEIDEEELEDTEEYTRNLSK